MFELSLGIVLAVWFVAVYFIYRRVFAHGYDDSVPVLPPPNPTHQIDGHNPERRFLNTADMSAHHAGPPPDDQQFYNQ